MVLKKIIVPITVAAILSTSFSILKTNEIEKSDLEKEWSLYKYDVDTVFFTNRKNKVLKSECIIKFKKGGRFKIKENEKPYGTIPINYRTETGKWIKAHDSVIVIEHTYLDKKIEKIYNITKLTNDTLIMFLVSYKTWHNTRQNL